MTLPSELHTYPRPATLETVRQGLSRCVHRSQLRIEVESDDRLVCQLVNSLKEYVSAFELFHEQDLIQIATALEEALLNAIVHGNLEISSAERDLDLECYQELLRQRLASPPYCHRKVTVSVNTDADQCEFIIRDEGRGFDPGKVPDPTNPALLCQPGGRGLLLIRAFMDQVEYTENGSQIRMLKRRRD